jgi:IS30 family transposase
VSHETIYRTLFVQTRGALKKELIEHLRTHRPIRRSRHATVKADTRGRIPTRSPSVSARRASRIEPSPVTGRATCCAARRTATSSRWSNGTPAT